MLKRITVNRHIIAANKKSKKKTPPLSIQISSEPVQRASIISIMNDGKEVAKVIYNPDKPLKCGATVWIETKLDIKKK